MRPRSVAVMRLHGPVSKAALREFKVQSASAVAPGMAGAVKAQQVEAAPGVRFEEAGHTEPCRIDGANVLDRLESNLDQSVGDPLGPAIGMCRVPCRRYHLRGRCITDAFQDGDFDIRAAEIEPHEALLLHEGEPVSSR